MSWSVNKMGDKDKVRAACVEEFEKCANRYTGTDEERDILAARERVLSCLDAMTLDPGFGVKVECSGSRSQFWLNLKAEVGRIELLL